jgi:CBS domain-containing protein
MIAKELLSTDLEPLKTSDNGAYALALMAEFYIKHLPIVNDQVLLGMVSEEDILDHDHSEPVGSYDLSLNRPYCQQDDHLFEVMGIMSEFSLTVVPVIDNNHHYLGLITQEDLLHYYAKSFSFSEPGSIVVLEISKRDYSLAEISKIVEGEQAAILSSFITTSADADHVFVTIKINRQEISGIISAMERYEYSVKATFTESDYVDQLKERYDSLMTYLNI